jgi:hypothetical protein
MNKKILIGSIFAAMLLLLVPFTAVAAAPSNDAPKEPNEKPETTLTNQLPAFDDTSTFSKEEFVRSIQAAADLLRDLGDESTADAIEQELSSISETEVLVMGTGLGPFMCAFLRLTIIAYLAAAALCLYQWATTGEQGFFIVAMYILAIVAYLQTIYKKGCGGNEEDVALANPYLTAVSCEEYAISGCNLCGSSSSQTVSK